jgi:hypothetical protein
MADEDLLRQIRERFERCVDADRDNREAALDDLEFRAGEQWPEDILTERESDGRPVITINRMPQFIRQVTGDIRINRPAVKVRPVDDKSDPDKAEILTGLVRHIEQASNAHLAYINAADGAATCGMGHFRVETEYADDDVFDQDIRIRRITNPFAVYWDPMAEELTKEDAGYCFVTSRMLLDDFEEAYPDASTSDFEPSGTEEAQEGMNHWWDGKSVRIAEYWCKKPITKNLGLLMDGSVVDLDENPDMEGVVTKQRKVKTHKIVQYIVNGVEVLEGPHDHAGKYIPIVTVSGEEVHIGERTVRHGVIRYAKDPQRLYNYWRTTTAETIALAPKAPFILTKEQIKGHEASWKQANRVNLPYLTYNADSKAPGAPQRQLPAQIPAALVNESMSAADDMKSVTGIYDAALGNRSNETSGKAIMARQQEGDVGTFVYVDNLAAAIGYCGKILVDLIPKIYDGQRVVRMLGEDDSEDFAEINKPVQEVDAEGNVYETIQNDLSVGKYDVVVSTGPSYSTKRMEAADSMMQFMQTLPGAANMVADLIAKNMDWPGADAIAERLKKTLPPGIDEDAPQPQAPPPDPRIEADMMKNKADIMKAQVDMEKTRVETEGKELDNATKQMELSKMAGVMQTAVTQAVQQTLMQILGPPQMVPQPGPGPEPGFSVQEQGPFE